MQSAKLGARPFNPVLAGSPRTTDLLIREVFVKTFGRKPTKSEAKLAVELVGSFAQKEGMEELLWRVAMLPEFQLI